MGSTKVKAILVAGGQGSRLLPFTRYTHKTLLPLHRRPVIDYALATIRRAGIQDITIIANQFVGQLAQHVGTGLPGERIHYVIEEHPRGVGHALNLARPHMQDSRMLVYFSDNIVSIDLIDEVEHFRTSPQPPGCVLLAREVPDPERFGVAVFADDGKLVDIVEKPEPAPSRVAIGGIYLYDEHFWDYLDAEMEARGEAFSITDLNRRYIRQGQVAVRSIGEEVWLDCGTPDALQEAAELARAGVLSPLPCNVRDRDPKPTGTDDD